MKFHTNIRIDSHPILAPCRLENLGKINIVSGKNDSGKTTLLHAINAGDFEDGIKFEVNESDVLEAAWGEHAKLIQFNQMGRVIRFDRVFEHFMIPEVLIEILAEKEVWYPKDILEFTDAFLEVIKRKASLHPSKAISHTMERYFDDPKAAVAFKRTIPDIFGKGFAKLFNDTKREPTFLISPKRSINPKSAVVSVESVDTEGITIISKLFSLKNQLLGSDDRKLFDAVSKAFTNVSGGYEFDIQISTTQDTHLDLYFSRSTKRPWIEAAKCGLGLQDLLIIIFFALEPINKIVLLEEPENHIHPEIQRRLVRFLSEETNKQYFISTHSNIFLNTTYASRIFFTSFENGKVKVSDATKRAEILNELGYAVSDNLISDLIILVEGPTDVPIIEEYLRKYEIDAQYNIKIWPLGGDIMDQVDLSIFAERYKVIALIDKDPSSDKVRRRFIEKCKELNIPVTRLKSYSIENYFSTRVLREVFKGQISRDLVEIVDEKSLEEQIGIDVKKNNRKLSQAMTIEEIKGTDLQKFFHKVKELCEN